jgi:hypothetical protein
MNTDIKISLTIELEGRTLVRKSKEETITVISKVIPAKKNKRGKELEERVKKINITHKPLMTKPAKLHIKLNTDAYYYMIKTKPIKIKHSVWNKMKENERLEIHLKDICDSHKGKSFKYFVLEE